MKRFKKEEGQEPTKAELAVLQVLWLHGPSTVRFVHDALNEGKEAAQYTTTLKLMQLMAEKGMLSRDESSMKHIYSAALEERGTKGQLLSRFIDTMYRGDVGNMMVALLGNEKTSAKDLQQLRDMLDKMSEKPVSEKKK